MRPYNTHDADIKVSRRNADRMVRNVRFNVDAFVVFNCSAGCRAAEREDQISERRCFHSRRAVVKLKELDAPAAANRNAIRE